MEATFREILWRNCRDPKPLKGALINFTKNLRVVAPSLQEFALGYENESMPNDYFDR